MAALDVARSLSLHPASPSSAASESFRFAENQAPTPEPHYRLSRLNTPPSSANLRPPSIISRSVSAGMTFSFGPKEKEKRKEKEKDKQKEVHLRAPSPDDRASSRFGFTLRKKVSLASLMSSASPRGDDTVSTRASTSSGGSLITVVSPIDETPSPLSTDEDDETSDGDEDVHAPERFVKKNVWRTRHKMKLHPYPDVPYMQSYDPVVLQIERSTHQLLRRLAPPGSPTFHPYRRAPPASALDLGCGSGLWLIDAARTWRNTSFVGLDLVDVALPPLTDGSLPNVRLVRGDFLKYALPFPDNSFALVRMAGLGMCVPRAEWERLLREVWRVLLPGGRLELVDDEAIFPYGDAPIEEAPVEGDVPMEEALMEAPEQSAAVPTHLTTTTTATNPLSPSTPRAPPPTPASSGFFDFSDDEEEEEAFEEAAAAEKEEDSDDEILPTPPTSDDSSDTASSFSFNDTESTLIGEASDRGSFELAKRRSSSLELKQRASAFDLKKALEQSPPQLELDFDLTKPPRLDFEPVHRPFSGVDHLVIAIPPPVVDIAIGDGESEGDGELPLTPVPPRGAGETEREQGTGTPTAALTSAPTPSPAYTTPALTAGTTPTTAGPTTPRAPADDVPFDGSVPFDDGGACVLATSGPWSTRCAASRDLERVYARMLSTQFGMPLTPADGARPLLARVFCEGRGSAAGRVEAPASMHLKLAPVGLKGKEREREGERERDGKSVRAWMSTMEWEKEGREGDVRKHKGRKHGKKEKEREKEAWARETPLPQGVSAKAAERLGIVGAAVPQVKRPPTLVESPEESDEEEAFSEEEEPSEDEPPLPTPPVLSADERARGASTWVPPSEWDAPPIVARVESASLPPSTSSRTITPSASARTVTPSTSSKTVKQLGLASMDLSPAPQRAFSPQTHTRGSSTASTASATSALSTASSAASSTSSGAWSASPPEPPRFAHGLAQHPGLILWPGTFIPVPPAELEMHATKHMQTLLASKPALAEFVARCVDPATGARLVSDEEFEDAVWDYECFRRPRFNWPDLPEGEEVSDMPTPVSARSTHHLMQPPRTPTVPGDREEVGPFGRHELVHVRTLRVFGAVKGGAPEIL